MPLLAATYGCGSDEHRLEVHPVAGTVLVSGKATAGVRLVFHPQSVDTSGQVFPRAVTDDFGKFRLSTYATADGIPAGEYVVTASWRQLDTEDASEIHPDELSSVEERLELRFTVPEVSPLKVTVAAGDNQLEPLVVELSGTRKRSKTKSKARRK